MGSFYYLSFALTELPRLAACIVIVVVAGLIARRTRSKSLRWFLLSAGIWPLVQTVIYVAFSVALRVSVMTAGRPPGYYTLASLTLAVAFPVIGCALFLITAVKLGREITRLPGPEPLCPKCQYNLRGLEANRCPECGAGFVCETRYLVRPA
jgi:hypothetical protein